MKNKTRSRHKARCYAMQAFYQWQYMQPEIEPLLHQFIKEMDQDTVDVTYFRDLVMGTIQHMEIINTSLQPFLDRPLDELNPVELAILRLAIYEFMYKLDVPYRVVINEALEITKKYGSVEGHKYVNGVLDASARQLRKIEINSRKK